MKRFIVTAVILSLAFIHYAVTAEEKVKVINGFEPEVLKEWVKLRKAPNWSSMRVMRINKDGMPYGGGMRGSLVKGDATEGEYALVREIPRTGGKRTDHTLHYLRKDGKESIRRGAGRLLCPFGTFRIFYPNDWSAYEKLRFDIKSETAPLRLRVDLEDSVIMPCLRRVYEIPAGKWVTVEYDLAKAYKLREVELSDAEAKQIGVKKLKGRLINLKEMAGFRIGIELLLKKTVVKMDNLRLVSEEGLKDETKLDIISDTSPFPVPAPFPPSLPKVREKLSCKLNTSPIEWEEPVEVKLGTKSGYGLQLMDVAPVDNDRMLMAVASTNVLKTLDGGKTWTGLDGTPNKSTRVIDHDTNAPGRTAGAMGPDIMVIGTAKCTGGGTPIESYSLLVRFDGKDWKVQPRGLVDVDVRHCPEHMVNVVRHPNGRIWTCWVHYNRFAGNDLIVRYSDDEGATWRDTSSNGTLDLITRGKTNAYGTTWWLEEPAMPAWAQEQATGRVVKGVGHHRPRLAPWGDNVICVFEKGSRINYAFYDGVKWGAVIRSDLKTGLSALCHFEDETVYMATANGKVFRLEGDKWIEDTPPGGVGKKRLPYPGCRPTRLSAAGDVLVAVWTDGKKLFTSQKPKGGTWSTVKEIFNEERGVHHLGVPVRSVENFVPFVWTITKGSARFVRIPVKQP